MYGALLIPDWQVVAAHMSGLIDTHMAGVITHGNKVISVNSWARIAGVRIGMGKREAQSLCPQALFLPSDSEREYRHFETILRALDHHVARVNVIEAGRAVFIADRAIQAEGGRENLADAIVGDVAQLAGCEAFIGFAPNVLGALIAAESNTYIPAESGEKYLESQNLGKLLLVLGKGREKAGFIQDIELLEHLGIHTLGDIVRLGLGSMSARFGRRGVAIWQLAHGQNLPSNYGEFQDDVLSFIQECEPPLEHEETVLFTLKPVIDEIVNSWESRSYTGGQFDISASFSDGTCHERSWLLESITTKDLLDRLRWQIKSWMELQEVSSPVSRVELRISQGQYKGTDLLSLWGHEKVHASQVERSIARIQSLLGEDTVRRAYKIGGRLPSTRFEERSWNESIPSSEYAETAWSGALPLLGPARLYSTKRTLLLKAECGHDISVGSDGELVCQYCAHNQELFRCIPVCLTYEEQEKIKDYSGPWLIEEYWWDKSRRKRRFYMQILCENQAYLIYWENGSWNMEGEYV